MLKQNGVLLAQMPLRFGGGAVRERQTWGAGGARRNWFWGEHAPDRKYGTPAGALHPAAWNEPVSSGGLASYTAVTGAATMAGAGALGRNVGADLAGTGGITDAALALIASAVAALTGSGGITDAAVTGKLEAAATLAGSGNLAGALGALASAVASIVGSGGVSSAQPSASGSLSADIRSFGTLSPENLALAVWSAVAAQVNAAGTMGAKLNAAGSSGDPWASVIENGETAAEILRLLRAVLAGEAAGLEGANPQFKSADGTKVRVDAAYASGNRTINAVDGS